MAIAELASHERGIASTERRDIGWPRWATPGIILGLYAIAAALLLSRLGQHPAFAYNWEAYTAYGLFDFWERPTAAILKATGGLMTDSSFSPLVILPGWLSFAVGGVGLLQLRIATALVAAAAVPLLWWTGRHFVGSGAALLAALLLALSPVFLLYGRTATLVGLSLVPMLVTIEALRRVLHRPDNRRWLAALQAALIVGIYCYAPIRFLWPIALLFLGYEYARRPMEHLAIRRAIVITLLVPWLAISVASLRDPATAIALYFEGRGEHIIGLSFETSQYGSYLRPDPVDPAPAEPQGGPLILGARLIIQNAGDLANLLLDRDTAPALTDYWNARGRLYPAFLVPFFALGLIIVAYGARRRAEDQLLLALTVAYTLPMIATSKVHIGRLIFFLPLLCLLVASGVTAPVQQLARRITALRSPRRATLVGVLAASTVALLILPTVAAATWRDYRLSPGLPPGAIVADRLRAAAANRPPGIALILRADQGEDPTEGVGEATEVAALRLSLDPFFRFISLYHSEARSDGTTDRVKIPLYYGNILGQLESATPDQLPCNVVFYVAQSALESFRVHYEGRRDACGAALVVQLP